MTEDLLAALTALTSSDYANTSWWDAVDAHPAYDYDAHELEGMDQHSIPCVGGRIVLDGGEWVIAIRDGE